MATVRALACAERETFADLLESLTPEQWDAPSLCAGWTVRDVAMHTIAYLSHGRIALARNMFAARWDVGTLNANALARLGSVQPGLLAMTGRAAHLSGELAGGGVALLDRR